MKARTLTYDEAHAIAIRPLPPVGGYKGMLAREHPRSYTWAGTIIGDSMGGGPLKPRTDTRENAAAQADFYEEL